MGRKANDLFKVSFENRNFMIESQFLPEEKRKGK